jgi:hypothetical protein
MLDPDEADVHAPIACDSGTSRIVSEYQKNSTSQLKFHNPDNKTVVEKSFLETSQPNASEHHRDAQE